MDFDALFKNKTLKPKARTEQLSLWLLDNPKQTASLIEFAKKSKDAVKATCLEAIEYATKSKPSIADINCFEFAVESLASSAPRVKWESAKVIGNTVNLFPKKIEPALTGLLNNSGHEGTVVRWSSAYAIGEIIKLKTPMNKELIPVAEAICEREEKNSIKKIYQQAINKIS